MSKVAKDAAHGGVGWSPRITALRQEIGGIWGACGVEIEWSPLKTALLHRPRPEIEGITDPNAVLMLATPEATLAKRQHDSMVAACARIGFEKTLLLYIKKSKRSSQSEKSLRFKIKNRLGDTDYKRLTDFLKDNPRVSIDLVPGVDLDFVFISPVTVAVEGFGYKVNTEIMFRQLIGFEVYDDAKLREEMHVSIAVNRRNLKLYKIVAEQFNLENDLNLILKIVERIVNNICIRFDRFVEQAFTLNSEWLDGQLNVILEREELEKRGETSRPFGTIHAKSSRDAKERAGGFIPLYKERDKTYLYDVKRVYFLLPHDFVANLLRCDDTTMVREEEFDKRGKEVLRDLVYKKRLRKHETLDGIICYFGLNEKTRRYLTKYLGRRTSRF